MRILNHGPEKISVISQEITWLLNERYNGTITKEAKKDIARLQGGEPVDYVIGYKKFLGCKIDLRYRPLIPRAETEFWVGSVIGKIADAHKLKSPLVFKCLDIFAGSGCVGIAALKHLKKSHCDFVDIDDNALKQIRLNLKLNKIDKKRYKVIKSDVFEKVKGQYDCIFANPPYIAQGEKSKVQKSALNFEPQKALFAKDKGLFYIKKFLQQAKQFLADDGVIYLEFDSLQKRAIKRFLERRGCKGYHFFRDQFGKWRYLLCCFVK
ncbi:MAG: HemK family protein methyltransferase [Candidatus Pacebacteria bacterium]|nr:HemK family protein methyltransferase [Candidatus Paceibacterota bacterium]